VKSPRSLTVRLRSAPSRGSAETRNGMRGQPAPPGAAEAEQAKNCPGLVPRRSMRRPERRQRRRRRGPSLMTPDADWRQRSALAIGTSAGRSRSPRASWETYSPKPSSWARVASPRVVARAGSGLEPRRREIHGMHQCHGVPDISSEHDAERSRETVKTTATAAPSDRRRDHTGIDASGDHRRGIREHGSLSSIA